MREDPAASSPVVHVSSRPELSPLSPAEDNDSRGGAENGGVLVGAVDVSVVGACRFSFRFLFSFSRVLGPRVLGGVGGGLIAARSTVAAVAAGDGAGSTRRNTSFAMTKSSRETIV
jgi:hypothetical protein